MKVLHTADWHIGQFKGPVENGVNLRAKDTIDCLEYMVNVARKEVPDLVCVSGDIFHQEQVWPARCSEEIVAATRIIEELSECAKFVVVMRGTPNHDGIGQFRVLSKMMEKNRKVAVVTTPQVISTPIADIACIPGFDKQEFRAKFPGLSAEDENLKWTEYISSMVVGLRAQCSSDRDKPSILMAHYTVPGCNMESGQTSFFSNFEPVIPREALQTAGYSAALLGHIHRPQAIEGLENVFYSGAVNAMNFNDEGQSRGFWIHDFNGPWLKKGHRYDTPYREFKTIEWTQEDVERYLKDGQMYLIEEEYPLIVADKIVRIKYSCTSEQKKALNRPLLESDLYDMGAFFVADVEAESMIEIANRGLLSEESNPLLNLKKWLDEKCVKDANQVAELGEPIISKAMKSVNVSENHGVLKPVSISVKNYRNYKEETFDFSDVSFCSINGVNGAGKSSLFMDAVVDCLYEETREGDTKAWIRGSEDARSGSIEFVFDIGDKRFRVVRTRTKSGRATLNISSKSGEEWLNLSAEKIRDTQAEVEKILGMDAMTFKSCALIMQDQYGLFLQAKKEDRMAILGNLLGLGVYGIMEQEARKLLADAKRQLLSQKEAVRVKTEFISGKGNPEDELEKLEKDLIGLNREQKITEQDITVCREKISEYKAAQNKSDELLHATDAAKNELLLIQSEKEASEKARTSYDNLLQNSEMLLQKAVEYEEAEEIVKKLTPDVMEYESCKRTLEEKNSQIQRYEDIINTTRTKNRTIEEQLAAIETSDENLVSRKLAELEKKREELAIVREKKDRCSIICAEVNKKHSEVSESVHSLATQLKLAEADLDAYRQQQEFMKNSGCPDIEKATCRFLEKAREDVAKIEHTEEIISTFKDGIRIAKEDYAAYADGKKKEISKIGYSEEQEKNILREISELEIYQKRREEIERHKALRARLEGEKTSNDKTIASCSENVSTVKLECERMTESISKLTETAKKYQEAKHAADELKIYADQKTKIPVYIEKKKHVEETLKNLGEQEKEKNEELLKLSAEYMSIREKLSAFPAGMEEKLAELEKKKIDLEQRASSLQIQKGILIQKIDDITKLKEEIELLKEDIKREADTAARYEILKQAFSQDGVPHQIVRNIIPHITNTANNILGQMTGGAMGVEFLMERTVKGKDGDKATLDVLIEEYGKTTLPYASKSGGEKVKASLAVILALSEIKATAAGIQLGMLFIDEPPFLDEEGVQAYVDSLETIRRRYPDVKIMAITHDEAMKARFNQSVTVVKTGEGSKVVY